MIFHINFKVAVSFPVFNTSGILGTSEMRIQIIEDLLETYPEM